MHRAAHRGAPRAACSGAPRGVCRGVHRVHIGVHRVACRGACRGASSGVPRGTCRGVCRGAHGGACRDAHRGTWLSLVTLATIFQVGDNREFGSLRHILRCYIHFAWMEVSEHQMCIIVPLWLPLVACSNHIEVYFEM